MPDPLADHLAALRTPDAIARREAAEYLGAHPAPAASDALLEALGDPDPGASEAIVLALAQQTAPDRVARLVTVLREDSPARRNAAHSALIEIGARGPATLLAALRHPVTEVRLHVAEVLGELRHPEAAGPLIERLSDDAEPPNVRHAAAHALGKIGDRAATPALIAAAGRADFWVRYASIEALGWLADEQAVPPLLRLLQQDAWMRPATVQALGSIGSAEAAPALALALDDPNEAVRLAALEALLKIVVEPGEAAGQPGGRLDEVRARLPVAPLRRELAAREAPHSVYAAHLLGWLAAPEALPDLIATLGHDDDALRLSALEAVQRYGPAAVPALLDALRSPIARLRENATEVLGMVCDASAAPLLAAHLADPDLAVRQAVLRALGTLGGEPAYRGILQALTDPATRDTALGVIVQLREPALIDYLRQELYAGDADAHWAAAYALSLLGDETAVSCLLSAMRLPDDHIRQTAAEALGRVRSHRAVGVLVEALGDGDWLVRQKAVEALGLIPDGRAVAAVVLAARDPEWRVRKAVVQALIRVGDIRVGEALQLLATDPNRWIRRSVVDLAGPVADPRAGEVLVQALRDPDAGVREAALNALGRRRDGAVSEAVAACLADPEAAVRGAAARSLALVDAEQALRRLPALAGDPEPPVRLAVADGLGELGVEAALPALERLLCDAAATVRSRAAEAIAQVGTLAAFNALVAALQHPRAAPAAQAELVRAGPAAVRVLLAAAHSPAAPMRQAAAETLGQIRSNQALPTLRALTRDPDSGVRLAAAAAVEAIAAG